MTTIIVCGPRYSAIQMPVAYCSSTTCLRPRRVLATLEPWHGWTQTCLTCGRQCYDGVWMPRPKGRRASRQIERAKHLWRRFKAGQVGLVEEWA